MTQKQYLKILRNKLSDLSREDKKTILEACQEHFREGDYNGLKEEEVAQSLGSPEEMAATSSKELSQEKNEGHPVKSAVRITFSGLALLFFNLIFVIWFFIASAAVLLAFWVTSILLFIVGVGFTFGILIRSLLSGYWDPYIANINTITEYFLFIFTGLSLLSAAGLLGIGMFFVSLWFFKFVKNYVYMNIHIIGGKR